MYYWGVEISNVLLKGIRKIVAGSMVENLKK